MKRKKLPTANSGKNSGRRGRVQNLKPWKPGQSGNLSGRPRKRPITERYAEFAELEIPEKERKQLRLPKGAKWADAGVIGTFKSMAKGNHGAAKEIREAIEGKSTQRVELTAEGGGPVKMTVEHTIQEIKTFYGLSTDSTDQTPDPTVPVSAKVDRGQEPQKDSEKK